MINKLILLILLPVLALASVQDDCYGVMDGNNYTQAGENYYTSYDNAGLKEACRNKFPSWGERMILKRQGTDAFEANYVVQRSYCWGRNVFDGSSCQWPTGSSFGDYYTNTFEMGDIKAQGDSSGAKVLMNNGWWGHHVCLRKYAPKEMLLHTGKNVYQRNLVCAYVVMALASDECNYPFGSWDNALIGCVEEPIKSPPPTFNLVIPASITPYIDPTIKLHDDTNGVGGIASGYISLGSTFDQPLIKLFNGNSTGGELTLKYKFPNDKRDFDGIPSFGSFPSDPNQIVYVAKVDINNPGKVCACSVDDFDSNIYVGCVDRPTPKDSGLKVVASYSFVTDPDSNRSYPAVYPEFVYVDGNGEIMYYDEDNSLVAIDANGNPTKADAKGLASSTPANGQLHYQALPKLDDAKPIGEYYSVKTPNYYIYKRDAVTSYGVSFEAMIPQMKVDGTPAFIALDTPYTRAATDGCGAYKIADDPFDSTKPNFFIPAGDRDRTYCNCPFGNSPDAKSCSLPPETKCNDNTVENHQQDAAKVFCPGEIRNLSQVAGSNNICLQASTTWQFLDYNYDKICVKIPTSCQAQNELKVSHGSSVWPSLKPGNQTGGICNIAAGNEQLKIYQLSPGIAVAKADFDCSKVQGNCDNAYNQQYLPQFSIAQKTLKILQSLANNFNRNLNQEDLNKIKNSLGAFKALHNLNYITAAPKRMCDIKTNSGLIENPCMQINSCSVITIPSQASGFATWSVVPNLNATQINLTKTKAFNEFFIAQQGICAAGYKPSDQGEPLRYCYIRFNDFLKVNEVWQPVINPCVIDDKSSSVKGILNGIIQ